MEKIFKPWGHEEVWAKTDKYVGKILFIKDGHTLSLQHHNVKEETILVLSGTLLADIAETLEEYLEGNHDTYRLKEGETIHISPGTIHRFSALGEDVKLMEVSTPELDDIVRHEDEYGRA